MVDINKRGVVVPSQTNYVKIIGIGLIVGLILGIIALFFLSNNNQTPTPYTIEQSEFAGDWIEENDKDNFIEINISEATNKQSEYTLGRQTYFEVNGDVYTLFIEAYHNGVNIRKIFDEKGYTPLNAGTNINPTDSMSEGFALLKRENGDIVLYLFVDEDWKKADNSQIFIVWSDDMSNLDNLQERAFDFSNSKQGVYFDKLNDVDWLTENPVKGKIFLGNLRKEDFIENNFNKTFLEII